MGKVVGCGLIAHVPTVMLPEDIRHELNNGRDFTVVEGFRRLRREVLSELDYDLVIVFDSHWFTTVEFIVTGHARRTGKYTSDELPRGMSQVPYDLPGDPEFAKAAAALGRKHGTWITAIDDPYLPIQYATVNPASYLQRGKEAWLSVSCAQTGESEDFLRVGRALREAIANVGSPRGAAGVGRDEPQILAPAEAARARGGWRRAYFQPGPFRRRSGAHRLDEGGRPCAYPFHHAGVPEVQAGGQFRPLSYDGGGDGRGRMARARPALQ